MMKEAAEILGYDGQNLDDYVIDIMDQKNKPVKNGRKDNGFRNFIINNVIESSRFKYLVRYGNPKKIRDIANNRTVIAFVLSNIPDEQIRRYYNSCTSVQEPYNPDMREQLADLITGISFKTFEGVHQNDREFGTTQEQIIDKERKKNLINLYLTVVYLLLKNLVYVNARYFMAFYCLERDSNIYYGVSDKALKDRRQFAQNFLSDHPQKKRIQEYL